MPTTLKRSCSWVSPHPEIDLRFGFPACLRVENLGSVQHWAISLSASEVTVSEEYAPGKYLPSHHIDTSFGGALSDWECDCAEFRSRGHRKGEAGCLHCRVAYAALKKIGLIDPCVAVHLPDQHRTDRLGKTDAGRTGVGGANPDSGTFYKP